MKLNKTLFTYSIYFLLLVVYLYYSGWFHTFGYIGIYEENILSKDTFDKVLDYCKDFKLLEDDPKADGRIMYIIPDNHEIYKTLYTEEFIERIRKLCHNDKLIPCEKIPIEYRKYLLNSMMGSHTDTKMLDDQLQYEIVITLTNTSDSETIVYNWLGYDTKKISTTPNSVIIVRANGVRHCVTKTTQGERTILKLAFCEP